MTERMKTSLMLPRSLILKIDEARALMGVGKNAFMAMGACYLLMHMSRLQSTPRKRRKYIAEVNREFQKLLKEALEDA